MSPPHVANIGERGARRRRRNGYVWVLFAAAAFVGLLVADAPPWMRLIVGVPAGLAAVGLLQAREKT